MKDLCYLFLKLPTEGGLERIEEEEEKEREILRFLWTSNLRGLWGEECQVLTMKTQLNKIL